MIIGIVPGAMKPYHAGHHYLVETALNECDIVTILTTRKARKGISGDSMYEIWQDYIIPHLTSMYPSKVRVNFVVSPIRTVYEDFIERLERDGNDGNTYRIYGGTEDSGRFLSNTMKAKYPVAAKYILNVAEEKGENFQRGNGKSPQAKGEWIREAIRTNNKSQFKLMMPGFLKNVSSEIMGILL